MAQSQSQSQSSSKDVPQDQEKEREVQARLAVLRGRFDDRLEGEQWETVRERVAKTIEHGEKLRQVALTNADEPEIVFVPYREDGR